jgi:uncharacterized OB-fold protein/acyl dehydratase
MIRHWVEAMGDRNPVYVDDAAARAAGFEGVVAPPTMLQAWIMRGLRASSERLETATSGSAEPGGHDALMALLDGAGFTSVVATDCEQGYARPLRPGDLLTASSVIESVSGEKQTALGTGHFVTTRTDFVDGSGRAVGTMRFRLLKFRPRPRAESGQPPVDDADALAGPPRRPAPVVTSDIAFFFEGAKEHRLLIQRCSGCGTLRHPPLPACASCRSFEWDALEASGRGTVFSFVVVHHPQVAGFEYPLPIALVELDEGTRLVADLVEVAPEDVEVGMAVEVVFAEFADGVTLPAFRPARTETRPGPAD